ncbi:MAG TPA: heavy metal translocating P-type ATPase [Synergistales bacterium]|nr:heavy metal translocating P-type ATPase [Synergistales bacterium]
MKRYRLIKLGCRGCAAKMEQVLAGLPGVTGASIDFENSILYMYGAEVSIEVISKIIKKIETCVEVEDMNENAERASLPVSDTGIIRNLASEENRPELLKLALALLLFLTGMISGDQLAWKAGSFACYPVFLLAYLISGYGVVSSAFRNVLRGNFFDEFFLMTLATFAAIALGFWGEAVGVMLFYRIGEFFQDVAASNSRQSIKALLASRPSVANVVRDGATVSLPPEQVAPGDIIVVRPGEKIPLDGNVLNGSSQVDTSPLTGEPVPVSAGPGDILYGGSINLTGLLRIRATSTYRETAIARILEMVEFAVAQKSPTERFITRFARYYTPGVVFLAFLVALVPPIAGYGTFSNWIYRALVLLIISCPCALMVSIPLGYFGGIGAASRHGILVKGGNVLDALTEVRSVVFDKTGTLTQGVFEVTSLRPAQGVDPEALLKTAALAEMNSNHPIARSILRAYGESLMLSSEIEMEEIPGAGVRATHEGHLLLAGKPSLLQDSGMEVSVVNEEGTVVHVGLDGKYLGYLVVSDVIRSDALQGMKRLKDMGISRIHMLTGDRYPVARWVSAALGIDSYTAELLPHEKVEEVKAIRRKTGGNILFAGDGINDAPSLATADVGVAMGGLGSEAAIETADLVILSDRPSEVAEAISIARKTRKIVWQNIILELGVKVMVLLLGIAGISGLWEAVFADVGVALLAVLNSARTVRMADLTKD